jgi:hypothetical protein
LSPSQDLNVVSFELEGGLLKFNSFSRSDTEDESKVNMHDVAFCVNQDVPIVPVLNLKDVCCKAVGSKTSCEFFLSSLVEFPVSVAIVEEEVVSQCLLTFRQLLFDCIDTHGVIDHLYKSTPISCCHYLIDLQPQRLLVKDEDLIDLVDELHCKLLLSKVISCFHNEPH